MPSPATLAKLLPKNRAVAPLPVSPALAADSALAELLPRTSYSPPTASSPAIAPVTYNPALPTLPVAVPVEGPVSSSPSGGPISSPVSGSSPSVTDVSTSTRNANFSTRLVSVLQGGNPILLSNANPNRKYFAVQNLSTETVYIQFSSGSKSNTGISLDSGVVWEFDTAVPRNAIFAYGGTSGSSLLLINVIEGIV
jgi:hypothetical protein